MVGSAKGRSMMALTTPWPRNSSRTSTQAISVPVTALIATTISESTTVSSSADFAAGLDTARQNPSRPPSSEREATAASGSRTMTLRYAIATPRPSAPGPPRSRRPRDGRATATAAPLAGASRHPQLALDPRDDSLLRVEELVLDDLPAAEPVDLEPPVRR